MKNVNLDRSEGRSLLKRMIEVSTVKGVSCLHQGDPKPWWHAIAFFGLKKETFSLTSDLIMTTLSRLEKILNNNHKQQST